MEGLNDNRYTMRVLQSLPFLTYIKFQKYEVGKSDCLFGFWSFEAGSERTMKWDHGTRVLGHGGMIECPLSIFTT